MKIELLENKTVKVVLSNIDMMSYNLTYEEMDYKNPETKKVIMQLIEKIKKEISIDLSTGKLFIEAFPYIDGGCILYVNMIDSDYKKGQMKNFKSSFPTPIVYSFNDINALGNLSKRMISRYNHVILKNSLYYYENKYFLLIYTYFKMDSQLSALLKEYGQFYGKGAVVCSLVKEHAKEIIEENAIETLVDCI